MDPQLQKILIRSDLHQLTSPQIIGKILYGLFIMTVMAVVSYIAIFWQ